MKPLPLRLTAEFLGTLIFVFIGAGSILSNDATNGGLGLPGIALAHGATLAVVVFAFGPASGGHINPAVTIGAWITKKISSVTAASYVVAQLAGSVVAAFLIRGIFPHARAILALGTPALGQNVGLHTAILTEASLTFMLALIFLHVSHAISEGRSQGALAIGSIFAVGMLVGGAVTGAPANPARAFGPALVSGMWEHQLVYWIGPILGAALAAAISFGLLHRSRTI